jgi:hypothetical protein
MKNLYHLIESFLLGELPEPERARFEQALGQDTDLARAVARHREVMDRLEGARLRQVVKNALKDPQARQIQPWRSLIWVLAVGACIGLLIWFTQPTKPEPLIIPTESTPSEPIAQHRPDTPQSNPSDRIPNKQSNPYPQWTALAQKYQVKPASNTLRAAPSANPVEKSALMQAQEAYDKGLYRETLQLLKNTPSDEDTRYYRANALFQLERFTESETEFKSLEQSFQYRHEARWNQFLCRLANGKLSPDQAWQEAMKMAGDENFELREMAAKLAKGLRER